MPSVIRSVSGIALALALFGCASHSDKTREIRSALDANRASDALGLINEKLDVKSKSELPKEIGGDTPLYLLDRAMVLQSLLDYKLSSRDLEFCDKRIELLDLSRNAAHEIGKYLFSDDVGPYKAPPYEKLMINTMNMVNYLVRGDLQGARIEARRLAVMQKFIAESEGSAKSLVGLGSYLAGFTFEKSGNADEALRYYDEALQYGDYPSLTGAIQRLSQRSGVMTPRLRRAVEAPAVPTQEGDADVLVIIGYGRVPPKIARRIPIGLALTYASGSMSPTDASRANALAAQGLVTWINFPELGKPTGAHTTPQLSVDGRQQGLEGALDVAAEARRAWDDARGPIVASAITRMIARVLAGEAVRRSAKDSTVGLLLSLGTQATLTAVDTPDTRSWETLPARVAVGRLRLPAGAHKATLTAGRLRGDRPLSLQAGGWAAVSLTSLSGS